MKLTGGNAFRPALIDFARPKLVRRFGGVAEIAASNPVGAGRIVGHDMGGKRTSPRIGRNKPCPCGAGRKYKRCCGVSP